jgi:hypothetical protein
MSAGRAADYGGDAFPSGETIAAVADRLQAHADRLDGHATLEVRAWDDGTMHAELVHTVGHAPGAAGVAPATAKQTLVYLDEQDAIEYREVLVRAGDRQIQTREVLDA